MNCLKNCLKSSKKEEVVMSTVAKSRVEDALDTLNENLMILNGQLADLFDRLGPFLVPSGATSGVSGTASMSGKDSYIISDLRDKNLKVQNMTFAMNEILERLKI